MSAPLMPADRWGERLTRRLGLWSAVAVLVGSTIGSGIFRTPAGVARLVDDVPLFLLAWVVGAAVVLCGALTYSELAAAFPRSGGVYVFVRESFGPLPAFLFTWAELLVIRPGAYGAIGITASAYTLRTLGYDPAAVLAHAGPLTISAEQVLGAVYIVLVGIVNYFGIHRGAVLQNLSTLLKAGALAVLILAGLLLGGATAADAAARAADRHRERRGAVPRRQSRVPASHSDAGHEAGRARGGGCRAPPGRPGGSRRDFRGDRRQHVRDVERVDDDGAADLLCGRRGSGAAAGHRPHRSPHVVPHRGRATDDRDGRHLHFGPDVQRLGGAIHHRDLAVLCAGGGGRLRVAPHTAAARAAVPDVGLSVRAARVSGGGAVRVGELPGLGNAEVRGRHRHHRDRCAGVPRHPPLPAPRAAIRDFSPLKPVGVQRAAPLRSFPAHRPSGRPTVLPVKHVPQTQLHPPNVRGSGEFLVGPRDQNCVGCRT